MRKHIKYIILSIVTLITTIGFSQEKTKDTIKTGVIDVVKPYSPTISDAFKVKEVPSLDNETTDAKKEIKYNILSVPVASTFTPAKGKAAGVEKRAPIKLFDNYATLGVGTYTTILGEVYMNHAISRNESVGGYLSHHSSAGGIENVVVDDGFSNSKIKVNYGSRLRDLSWNVNTGFQHQHYNWYGLDETFVSNDPVVNSLDVGHSFFDANFGGDITFEDTYINSGSFLFRRFTDNKGSGENRFVVNGKVDVPINDIEISTDIKFDYLGGNFKRNYFTNDAIEYGNIQVGLSPSFQLKQDDLTLNLGVSLFYLNDRASGDNKVYLFPNIQATYRLVNEVLIAYGGIEGDLIQNTYHGFANENPFVSPTLNILPTDQVYNAYVGLKGKVSSNMSYNISGHYKADRNKALYKSNLIKNVSAQRDYEYGNSFGIVYDDVETFGFTGEINVDVNRNFTLGLKAEYFAYNTDNEKEAWNLPDIKGSLFVDYQNGNYYEDIITSTSISDEDVLPLPYLFRGYKDMPKLEQKALKLCKGRVLDVGCGSGSHSLYLQKKGFEVKAIDISKGAIEVAKQRGVKNVEVTDILNETASFDTILLLMNGTGIFQEISQVSKYLNHLKSLLKPNGQILIDSSDIKYMYEDEDGGFWIDTNAHYYGELDYFLSYKGEKEVPMKWLYLNFESLKLACETVGLKCELVLEGSHFDYLAKLTLTLT